MQIFRDSIFYNIIHFTEYSAKNNKKNIHIYNKYPVVHSQMGTLVITRMAVYSRQQKVASYQRQQQS